MQEETIVDELNWEKGKVAVMTESEKTAKQKEKEAKKKAEKEAKLEKLRLKQQKQEEAKKAKESKVCSLSTFSCTNSPNQFGCFIFSIIISYNFQRHGSAFKKTKIALEAMHSKRQHFFPLWMFKC